MQNTFFAMLSRMKYIERWALMRNSKRENISEHSMEVAIISHALAILGNIRLSKQYEPDHVAALGLYHDCTEILTGDMPTPVKYNNPEIQTAYKQIEKDAAYRLLELLPKDLKKYYESYIVEDQWTAEERLLVKAADKLSALIKCIEEEKAGNREFANAYKSTINSIHALHCPEAEIFCDEFLEAFEKTLDEL